jgi:hypothetical protein
MLEVPFEKYRRRRHLLLQRWYIWIISQRGLTAIAIRFVASALTALIIIAVANEVLLHTHAVEPTPTGVVSDTLRQKHVDAISSGGVKK